jgi:hypothetical protein
VHFVASRIQSVTICLLPPLLCKEVTPTTCWALSDTLLPSAAAASKHRGYTRKEPYANHLLGFNWTPRAENWNGRVAMLGFAGMVLTEWITGVNTLQAWGLQGINFPGL